MRQQRERRQLPRTPLPWRIPARIRDVKEVRILDLSAGGTRLEHLGLLRPGAFCDLELPTILGGLLLPTHVAWCAVIGRRRGFDGDRHLLSHTGLRFSLLTPTQHASLAAALERLASRRPAIDRRQGPA